MKIAKLLLGVALYFAAHGAMAVPFTETCTDCPLGIAEDGSDFGLTDSSLVVTTAGTILDLNVFIEATHTWIGDLDIFLRHVDSNIFVQLWDNGIGNLDDLVTTFDDESLNANMSCGWSINPCADQLAFGSLSAFDGLNLASEWILVIDDVAGGDSGMLITWNINGQVNGQVDVPEPGTLALLGIGLIGFAFSRRRRRA